MTDRVALLVQASQDQQNNSVKHPETVQELYSGKLSLYFEWSPPVPLKTDVCTKHGTLRIIVAHPQPREYYLGVGGTTTWQSQTQA